MTRAHTVVVRRGRLGGDANNPLSSLLRPLQIIAHWEGTQSAQNSTLQPLKLGVGRWQSGVIKNANTPLGSLLMPLQIIVHWEGTQSAQNSTLQPLKLGV